MRFAYALAGEGRGHTTRALGLGQELIDRGHEVRFFTDGDALALLRTRFGPDAVVEMPVPRFAYSRRGVNWTRTLPVNAGFILRRRAHARRILPEVERFQPDACIADFEPTLHAVARMLNIPIISFDSQHFANVCRLRDHVPLFHRIRMLPVAIGSRMFLPRPSLVIVSKAFGLPTRREGQILVGPVLRPRIRDGSWKPEGTHLLAYLRGSTAPVVGPILEAAAQRGLQARFYGMDIPDLPDHGVQCEISEDGFIRDMLSTDLMITTAGSQVIGEVAHLGVPSLIVPEPGQVEQDINARLAEATCSRVRRLNVKDLGPKDIHAAIEDLSERSFDSFGDGTSHAADVLLHHLEA